MTPVCFYIIKQPIKLLHVKPANNTCQFYLNVYSPWEQAAQDRTKWRCLIIKGASQFEEKRICEAERKRKERKERAKEPSSVSAQSEFTCSICNRQFRAKIGLYSHQRTHKHTETPNIQELRWSFSVLRDEQSMYEGLDGG